MVNDRTPLLPQTQQASAGNFPSSNETGRTSSRKGAVLVAVCVFLGLLGLWRLSSANPEDTKTMQTLLSAADRPLRANEGLNYLVVGDWGREGFYNQSLLATQMGRIAQELGIEFVISAGDNFYDTGLTGEDDPAFSSSFTDVYTASSLQTTWYTVLGNHDYMGDVLAELSDALVERDSRWYCKRAFQLNYTLCSGTDTGSCDATVDMFFFDTTPFIDEYWSANSTETFDWRGLAPRVEQLQSQLDDLAEALNSSTATWKIVVGHHTIRSIGHHGDYPELLEKLLPILEEHKVDVYINGHDHNVQHIKRSDSPVHFFTSGGGSKAYSGLREYTEVQGVQFAYDGQGFLAVSMRPESISFTFYDVLGDAIYNYLLQK
ncbi:hypothetical protein GOP47_0000578 [Adiantum capillus-veneris]|uniref:Purple acid phosphatase n=1 Tax=Adiantum capillus-veneris TaxID=13818 RepID=A0A9D4VE53_ADICA|nr:hypothetical protein GOP47_0000578 [Adiantum capillus-veneris]